MRDILCNIVSWTSCGQNSHNTSSVRTSESCVGQERRDNTLHQNSHRDAPRALLVSALLLRPPSAVVWLVARVSVDLQKQEGGHGMVEAFPLPGYLFQRYWDN
jgi:hypothetical protein